MADPPRIKLTGCANPQEVDEIVSSSLVDVVYTDEILGDTVYLVSDPVLDLRDRETYLWAVSVIEQTLRQSGIQGLQMVLVDG